MDSHHVRIAHSGSSENMANSWKGQQSLHFPLYGGLRGATERFHSSRPSIILLNKHRTRVIEVLGLMEVISVQKNKATLPRLSSVNNAHIDIQGRRKRSMCLRLSLDHPSLLTTSDISSIANISHVITICSPHPRVLLRVRTTVYPEVLLISPRV